MISSVITDGAKTGFDQAESFGVLEDLLVEDIVQGSYDPATSTHLSGVSQSYTVRGLPDNFRIQEIDGSNVQAGDVRIYVLQEEVGFEPLPDHKATFRGAVWGIMDVRDHAQTLYEIQLRRPI